MEDKDKVTIACPTCNSPSALGPYCNNPQKMACVSCGCLYKIHISIEQVKEGKIIFEPIAHAEAVRKRIGY